MASLLQQVARLSSKVAVFTRGCLQANQLLKPNVTRSSLLVNKVLPVCFSVTQTRTESSNSKQFKDYSPPSPYKQPGPRRYGYENKMYGGGVLPRPDVKTTLPIPRYNPKDGWSRKKALFGQNDYIDILGNGDVHPVDLMRGPSWLIGFKGNELQRLTRRLRFQGRRMRMLYPTKYQQIRKRIYFLYKKYNRGRKSHSW